MSDQNPSRISTIIHHPVTQKAGMFVILSLALKGAARTVDEGPWKGATFTKDSVQHLISLFNSIPHLADKIPTVQPHKITELDGYYVPQTVTITAGLYALTWLGKKLLNHNSNKEQDNSSQLR